ncbi:MAG: LptF/LptG family permease [Aquificaceae bacterium]|nr:LptF/LptG family permease [Aquificaceae bacterium]MDW8237634.1 LptF/LptG family permease [Aquificaceae bacterium]
MLHRYVFLNCLKYTLGLTIGLVGILQIYLLGDALFSKRAFLSLFFWSLPVFIFYALPVIVSISCILVLRSLQRRRLDFAFFSFGMSPFKLSLMFAPIGAFLAILSFILSLHAYPMGQSRLNLSKEPGGVIKDLWLVQKFSDKTLFYHFGIVDLSSGNVYDVSVLELKGYSITRLSQGKTGTWLGKTLKLESAKVLDLFSGQEIVRDLTYDYVVLEKVGQLAKRPEELKMTELILLTSIGKQIGLNHRQFLREIVIRVLNSLAVFVCSFSAVAFGLSTRSWKFSFAIFVAIFTLHWLSLNVFSTLLEKTTLSVKVSLLTYMPVFIVLTISLYYLRKLRRV